MRWLIWNVKELNKPLKQREMGEYLKKHQINLAGLLETKVTLHNLQNSLNRCAKGWTYLNNYGCSANGRIWLILKATEICVMHQVTHGEFIHCLIKERNTDFTCALTVIYGSNNMEERRELWEGLKLIGSTITMPWSICGDFNSPLTSEDRIGGQLINDNEIRDFQAMMNVLNLVDIKTMGRHFTWTNKHIWSKLTELSVMIFG